MKTFSFAKKPRLQHQRNAPPKHRPVTHLKRSRTGSNEKQYVVRNGGKQEMESQTDLLLPGLFQYEDKVSNHQSSLQGWLSMFSSRSRRRTLIELCEASRERCVSGCDKLQRKCAANTLVACQDKSKSAGTIPDVHATTE